MNITAGKIDFNKKKGFICDMDGVIYHGNRILPGVAEFIKWLHDENKGVSVSDKQQRIYAP